MSAILAKVRMTYRAALSSLGWPKWLVRETTTLPDGTVIEHENRALYAIVTVFDELSERVRLGVEARFPGLGASDARAQTGRDRRVLRGPAESDDAYDGRQIRAVDDQRVKGSPDALLEQVFGYLSPFAVRLRTVDNSGNWVTRDPDGTITRNYYEANWGWDDQPISRVWGRYWLIIYPGATGLCTDAGVYGTSDGQVYGEAGATWGTSLSQDQVSALRQLAIEWRPEGVMPQWIIIAFDDASFDPATPPGAPLPDGLWGPWGQPADGAPVAQYRLQSARYIDVDPHLSISHH
jgi:hypothetical protein